MLEEPLCLALRILPELEIATVFAPRLTGRVPQE
jgi:hypothetical protein